MDLDAARRARRRAMKDLTQVYTDEEAAPPEWLDLMTQVDDGVIRLGDMVDDAARRFVTEPDIRVALRRRELDRERVEATVSAINQSVRRLNLIAPAPRFQRFVVEVEQSLRPLFRARRP